MQCVLTPATQYMPMSNEDIAARVHQQVGSLWMCWQGQKVVCRKPDYAWWVLITLARTAVVIAQATATLHAEYFVSNIIFWQLAGMPCKARASSVSVGVEAVSFSTRTGTNMAQHS